MEALAKTHQGLVRESHQDRFLINKNLAGGVLMAVADGMGGEAGGEIASALAIEALKAFDPTQGGVDAAFRSVFLAAHEEIEKRIEKERSLRGMGTTLTAVYVKDGEASFAHVGDSRLYLWRDGKLLQKTSDHTIPGMLVEMGRISPEEGRLHHMRNALQKCLGCKGHKPDTGMFELKAGDMILVCSDGLHGEVPHEVLEAVMTRGGELHRLLEALIQAALDAGGSDNITVAAVNVE